MDRAALKALGDRVMHWGDQVLHPVLQQSAPMILGPSQLALEGEDIQCFLLMLTGEVLRQHLLIVSATHAKVWQMDHKAVSEHFQKMWDEMMRKLSDELTQLKPLVGTANPENN